MEVVGGETTSPQRTSGGVGDGTTIRLGAMGVGAGSDASVVVRQQHCGYWVQLLPLPWVHLSLESGCRVGCLVRRTVEKGSDMSTDMFGRCNSGDNDRVIIVIYYTFNRGCW